MATDTGAKWVVFIDCLDEKDLGRTEFMADARQGTMEATPPRVTPRVMSSIYSGLDPAENGMMRSQMFGQPDQTRPHQTTVMERTMANGMDVLSFHMPFAIPMNLFDGSAAIGSAMGGQQQVAPQQLSGQLQVAGPTGDLIGDRRHDIVFDHMVDHVTTVFSTARSLAPNYDVVFIGYRGVDSYCHFQYRTNENGRGAEIGERYRDRLAEVIDIQLQQTIPRAENLLFFSDHGATDLTRTVYINKWLKEHGYLDYEVDTDFIDTAREYGMMGGEQHPVEARVENQTVIGQPGVKFDEDNSQAVCADPFDSCITWIGDSDDEMYDLIDDLSSHEGYRDAYHKSDLFDEDGRFYEQTPHVIPDRAEGTFVSGNVHPDPIGMSWYRTGVHTKHGVYGATTDVGRGTVTPEEMNSVIEEFLGIDRNVVPAPEALSRMTERERNAVKRQL